MLRIYDSAAAPAKIPLRPGGPHPRFSVMLPTFDPDEKLQAAVRSVLAHGLPADRMQIAIVDDGSRPGLARDLLRSVDPEGRVELTEFSTRLGLAGNWNRAVALSRGDLVHLLHQDDYVQPGFYAAIDHGFRTVPDAGMAFCRSRIVDDDSRLIKVSSRLRWLPGIVPNWLSLIAERQRVQTPAAVVRRAVYETLGGYRGDLVQTLDWEMWVRIAARHPVWYEPQVLAVYRRHPDNESARLAAAGAVWPDILRAIGINAQTLPDAMRSRTTAASARWHAASACRAAERLLASGDLERAAQILEYVPPLLRLCGADAPAGTALKRLSVLRSQVVRAGQRAA